MYYVCSYPLARLCSILCGPSAVWLHTATSKNNTEDYDTTENEKEDGDDDEVLRPNTPSESQHRA